MSYFRVLYQLGHTDVAVDMADIFLDAEDWSSAIQLVDALGDASLRSYVACRTPQRRLEKEGRGQWIQQLPDVSRSIAAAPETATRADVAHMLGVLGVGLENQEPLSDMGFLLAVVRRFPFWRHPQRLFLAQMACSGVSVDKLSGSHRRYREAWGVDPAVYRWLARTASPDGRAAVTDDLVSVIIANPHWAQAWVSLCQLAPPDDFDVVDFALRIG